MGTVGIVAVNACLTPAVDMTAMGKATGFQVEQGILVVTFETQRHVRGGSGGNEGIQCVCLGE